MRNGAPIARGTSTSYVLVVADRGAAVSALVVGKKLGYDDGYRLIGPNQVT